MHSLVTEMLPLASLLGDKRKSFKRLISSMFGFEVELIEVHLDAISHNENIRHHNL